MSQEYLCLTDRVVLSAQTQYFCEATVIAEAVGERQDQQSRKLSRLVVEFTTEAGERQHAAIPKQALHDAGPVYMNRWEFREEDDLEGNKYLYLFGLAPHEIAPGQWRDKRLHFIFVQGRFTELTVDTPLTDRSERNKRYSY